MQGKISARYPIVESLNAVLWTLSAYFIGLNANAFIYDALFSALIVMTFIDIDTKEIPNGIVVFIIILSIPLFFTAKDVVWWHRLVGAVVISVPLYVIALVTGGIGGGDIKLYFALGLVLGLYPTLVSAFIAIVSAGLIGGALLLTKRSKRGTSFRLVRLSRLVRWSRFCGHAHNRRHKKLIWNIIFIYHKEKRCKEEQV